MREWFRRLACLLTALLTLGCVVFWPEKAELVRAEEYLSRVRSPWEGTLVCWQVSQWRTASMTRSAAAEQALRRVEARYPGLYIQFEEITAETLATRLERGELPDLLSLPGSIEAPDPEYILPLDASLVEAAPFREAKTGGVPWMWSGSLVLVRMSILRGGDIEEDWTAEDLFTLLAENSEPKSKKPRRALSASAQWLAGWAAWGWTLPEDVAAAHETDRLAYTAYREGSAQVLLGGLWEAAALGRLEEAGKADPFIEAAVPSDVPMTVQAQYLYAYRSPVAVKEEVIRLTAAEFLSPATQKAVAVSCGCLPVTELDEAWELNSAQLMVWERARENTAEASAQVTAQTILSAIRGEAAAQAQSAAGTRLLGKSGPCGQPLVPVQ